MSSVTAASGDASRTSAQETWSPRVGDLVRVGRGATVWQVIDITETLITLERNHWTHYSVPRGQVGRLRPVTK